MNVKQQEFMTLATRYHLSKEQAEEKFQIYKHLRQLESNLNKNEIINLATRIKPLSRDENGQLHWIEYHNIRNSFCWNRSFISPASNLVKITEITTYHDFAYHGLVKASALEILTQLPDEFKAQTIAFETYLPSDNVYDFTDFLLNRHILKTILYSGELPEEIATQQVWLNLYEF